MKKLLMTVLLWSFTFLLCSSRLAAFSQPVLTYQVGISSITTTIVTVSTSSPSGASQMDNPQLPGRVVLEIDNIDASANLWCLPVSTMPVANGGRLIPAKSSWVVSVADGVLVGGSTPTRAAVKFWCLSDGAAATKAAVTQLY